ncbi:MAG: winged helix-turn-helix transcriptional regulator [Promethearchaeota archaeon]
MPKKKNPKLFLLHPTRWQIYKIICENPGTYFYRLMTELPKYTTKASSATIMYHLKKLRERGLLKTLKIDGKRIYIPNNLRTEETERAFMLLKNDNARLIFQYIINHPVEKPFQNEIARELDVHHDTVYWHAEHLINAGLIEREREGKYTRFIIGYLGKELLTGSLNIITEEYLSFIMEHLSDGCHFPEIILKSEDKVVVRVVCPDEDDLEVTISLGYYELELETKN